MGVLLLWLAIDLRHAGETISIDPATLAATWNGSPVSAPQTPVAVRNLVVSGARATWTRGADDVTADLGAGGLRVTGAPRWPVIPEPKSWVLPRQEGWWIPGGDPRWRAFLKDEGALDGMADLSMPVVGAQHGGATVVYLFLDPLHLTLRFDATGAALVDGRDTLVRRRNGTNPLETALVFREWFRDQFVSFDDKRKALPAAERLLGAAHVYLWAAGDFALGDIGDWRALARAMGEPVTTPYVDAWTKRRLLAKAGPRAKEFAKPGALGSALDARMIDDLRTAGLDRLVLGLPDPERASTAFVRRATEAGYLLAPYDSYHSIHHPNEPDTWPTAQFDREAFETGAVVKADGTRSRGFQGKGAHFSSRAAEPWFFRRVTAWLKVRPANAVFIDCDATGELFDNHSPRYRHTRQEDMQLRQKRLAWLVNEKKLVVGSEGGAWFATPMIHFAHGMMSPLFGWGDPKWKELAGKYAPPEEPSVFFAPVAVPPRYEAPYFDPRHRLPLFQAAFHDSVITTNHWLHATAKFTNVRAARELLETLYGVPPLYHLNRESLGKLLPAIQKRYRFFSPLHRAIGGRRLLGFDILTEDRLLQRSIFEGGTEITANFSAETRDGIPALSARVKSAAGVNVYTP